MKAGVTVWRYLIFFLQRILWLFWGLCFLETICKSFFLSLWSPTIFFPFSRCLFFFSFWEVTSCAEFSLVGCLASRQIDVFYNVRENFSFFIVFVRIIGFHLPKLHRKSVYGFAGKHSDVTTWSLSCILGVDSAAVLYNINL